MASKFTHLDPATGRVWSRDGLYAALTESRTQLKEWQIKANNYAHEVNCLKDKETFGELTWGDVQKRFIMPRVKRDLVERPLFAEDVRCGYRSLVQWIKEGYAELRKPVFH